MNTQRYIIKKSGEKEVLFDEKCVCGSFYEVCFEGSDLAWCPSCGRIYRLMEVKLPSGDKCFMWGIYIDHYLKNTLAGQFIDTFCGGLPPGFL